MAPRSAQSIRRRLLGLWSSANDATNLSERASALEALKRLQRDHDLSDVELNFIAEYERAEPSKLDGVERSINVFELIIHLIRLGHIVVTFEQAVVLSIWILHTFVCQLFLHSPRLILRSTEPGCGKSALMSLMKPLVDQGFLTGSTTPAVIYHRLKRQRCTFLIDEFENSAFWRDDTLRAVLNMGHRQGVSVSRMDPKIGEEVEYPAYFPLALALVEMRRLTAQLLSRSIILEMITHAEGRDEIWPNDPRLADVHRFSCEWASTFRRPPEVKMPTAMVGRLADNWRVLFAVADSLGYGATARAVALTMTHDRDDNPVARLFVDIHQIFEQHNIDRIWTEKELLPALHGLVDAPWDEFRGIDGRKKPHKLELGELYDMLHTKRLRPKPISKRVEGERRWGKGFYREDFAQVWAAMRVTPSRPSKIISLPRHKKRHGGGTDTGTAEE